MARTLAWLLCALALAGCAGEASVTRRPDSWASMNEPDPPTRYENATLVDAGFSIGPGAPENSLELAIDHGTRNARVALHATSGAAESVYLRLGPCERTAPTLAAGPEPLVLACDELDGLAQALTYGLRAGALSGRITLTAEVPVAP